MEKNLLIKTIFKLLGKGIIYCVKEDKDLYNEFDCLPNKLSIRFDIMDNGSFLWLNKNNDCIDTNKQNDSDLVIIFKNNKSAKKVLFGKISIAESFARHDILLKGDIANALTLVRIIDAVEYYLFPRFITKKFLPNMKKRVCKGKLYLFVIFGNANKKGREVSRWNTSNL